MKLGLNILMPFYAPLAIVGPSGAGKATLVKKLMAEYPKLFTNSVSHTTRAPRKGEKHGADYHYVSEDDFKNMANENL
jgi:guanylate kinase